MIPVILPSQHLARRDGSTADSQRRLMIAVLRTAIDDCRDNALRDPQACREARAYVDSRDRSWPFSFENICEAVGFDADSIRRGVRRAEPG